MLTLYSSGILAERPAEELFATDLTGEESVQKDYGRKHKPLRSEQIIAQRSAVPAVDSRKRKSDGIATGSSKRSKNGVYVPHSELERLKALAYSTSSAKPVPTPISAAYDPWAVVSVVEDPTYSFIDKAQPAKEPQTLKHPPISLASSGKPFAAVKKPEAGKSYNPAFEDWDALVTREGIKEVEAERKRVEDAEKEEARLAKAIAEAAIPEPNPEDDDYMSAWESEWEGIQSEAEDSHLDKKRPERKSQSERNKIKKRKEAEAKALWEKQMKKRQDQENRIKEISRAVAKKERQRQLAAIVPHVDSSEDEEVLRRRKLGRNPCVTFHIVSVALLIYILTDTFTVYLKHHSSLSSPMSCKTLSAPSALKAIS